jgi:hypothetical protein
MCQRVHDLYDNKIFEDLLQDAINKASGNWENNFVSDIKFNYLLHNNDMFLSDLQNDHLHRIANRNK